MSTPGQPIASRAKVTLDRGSANGQIRASADRVEPPPGKIQLEPDDRVAGWGRVFVPGRERRTEDLVGASNGAVLFRGLARSYGDASIPPPGHPEVIATPLADRLLSFDEDSGRVRAEAGLTLRGLNLLFIPRGFFTPVTPGTQYVTLGGMVAADVHGKNHHRAGCFGQHVTALRMRVPDGRVLECGPDKERDLFHATVGGMGLLGHILEVEFCMKRIPSPWIWSESVRIPDIEEFIGALKAAGTKWPYTVGWIDCLSRGRSLGRGILMRGRWAEANEAPLVAPKPKRRRSLPFVLPEWVLGRLSVRAFNEAYYHTHIPRKRFGIQHPETFFYPLDKMLHWNRMYGRRGFTQYQCVLPESAGHSSARRFLELLTSRGGASFLCVIKDCGAEGAGILSFPKPGISIALDIAIREDTRELVDALNELVIREGGRIYLAKDSFTTADDFRRMEPRLSRFEAVRERFDPHRRVRSAQSVRILGDPS